VIRSAWPTSRVHLGRGAGDSAGTAVQAQGLTKRFGEFTAVDAVDFDIEVGEAFGFLGANGAGKTSTMRMIACLSPISGGTLQVLGLDPMRDGPQIRSRIGLVPQETPSIWNSPSGTTSICTGATSASRGSSCASAWRSCSSSPA